MRAMVLHARREPLRPEYRPDPRPGPGQVVLRVTACGVCRTDLHVVDGELPSPKLPLIPGHEIVGRVVALSADVERFKVGDRVGVPWMGWACGGCPQCRAGRENLCPRALFTGYTLDGGYAEQAVADARFCLAIPPAYADTEAAPLLCAGLIGYRCLRRAGSARRIGLYGFGAAAHLLTQVAGQEGREVLAFTRPGDHAAQGFARRLGASWAGGSDETSPVELDAAIIFAPRGDLVPAALRAVRPGGCVVCGGIHMSDIPAFPYELLWHERSVCSVANLTRSDGAAFFDLVMRHPVRASVQTFPLAAANEALAALREGRVQGAAVLVPDGSG